MRERQQERGGERVLERRQRDTDREREKAGKREKEGWKIHGERGRQIAREQVGGLELERDIEIDTQKEQEIETEIKRGCMLALDLQSIW